MITKTTTKKIIDSKYCCTYCENRFPAELMKSKKRCKFCFERMRNDASIKYRQGKREIYNERQRLLMEKINSFKSEWTRLCLINVN
jgi:hypothetical protein